MSPRGGRNTGARVAVWLAALLAIAPATAMASPSREHRVKAVFLFNFAQFVEWPDSAFSDPKEPLVVGILGEDPFQEFLDEVVKGESVRNRPIVVRRYKKPEEIKACHVLFISSAEAPRMDAILAALKDRHILTVGESELFRDRGGMVSFATEGGKVRLRINLDAVHGAHLVVSSKLLRLADTASPRRQ